MADRQEREGKRGDMFAVMEWIPQKKRGFFARRRALKHGLPPEAVRQYAGGVPYLSLRVERGLPLSFEHLAAAAGNLAGRMLLPGDVVLPPDCPLARFDTESYRTLLLFSGVRRLLFEGIRQNDPQAMRVGLYDPAGRCAAAALRLLRYTESVRILTGRLSAYAHYSRKALEMYGVEFIFSRDPYVLDGCSAIVAPFGMDGGALPSKTILFSGRADDVAFTLNGDCITLPAPLEAQRPPGIDRLDFAAALHSSARFPALSALIPHSFSRNGKLFSLKSIANAFFPLDKTATSHYNISIVPVRERT